VKRSSVALLAVALLAVAFAADAQPAARIPRIGFLMTASLESPESKMLLDAFRQGMLDRGYAEERNVIVEYRSAGGRIERFPELATELVRLKVDLIVAGNTAAVRAAQQATSTIPIVSYATGDPVGDGLVASLAKPGRNITGLTFLGPELVAKRLELLKEVLPRLSRAAVLWHPSFFSERTNREMVKETEAAARTLAVRLQLVGVESPDEFDRAFSAMAGVRADALFVFPGGMLYSERRRIVALAEKHRLPAI
jgi:putative ABC transport system substrate-binding protein